MRPLVIRRGTLPDRAMRPVGVLLLIVLVVLIPFSFPPYQVFEFAMVGVYAMAVLGLNLLTGYTGLMSIGHNAFVAIGAYTAAIVLRRYHLDYVVAIPLAGVSTFILGFLLGLPARRLRGIYLAIVTLGIAVIISPILKRFSDLTGGSTGLSLPTPTAPAWSGLGDDQFTYFIVFAALALMIVVARNLVSGQMGRALRAVRDHEMSAESMGVDASWVKVMMFGISSMFGGIAGGFYVFVNGFVSPDAFPLLLSVSLLAAMVVGGAATLSGSVIGALFIEFVPASASAINPAFATLLYGAILICVMMLFPPGMAGGAAKFAKLLVRFENPPAPTRSGPVAQAMAATAVGEPEPPGP
jgi:branched-chain amino acid transport system permease protein